MALPLVSNSKIGAVIIDASLDVQDKVCVRLDAKLNKELTSYHETCRSHLRELITSNEHVPITFFGL